MINLYNGDCLQVMDDLIAKGIKVDCIITDPPYKVITGGNKSPDMPKGILRKNKQLMNNIPNFNDWLGRCYQLLKDNSHIYIMTNFINLKDLMIELEKEKFYLHNLLVWKKNNATPNRWYMKNCEYIIFAKKGNAKSINNCGSMTVHDYENIKNKQHPTQKPIEMMELYIANSSNENDVILDPFMGSGSTGVACKNLNRKFIGIELDENYFKIAKERIEETNEKLV